MKKFFFFDLDSTLLQMNQDLFLNAYFKTVAAYSMKLGYDYKVFMQDFGIAAEEIIRNDGSMTNEDRFWNTFCKNYPNREELVSQFDSFYRNEFQSLESLIQRTDTPRLIIDYLKNKGYSVVLATNPVFPTVSTYSRIRWAGLSPDSFLYISTYENSTYCKPKKEYFNEILAKLGINASDCVMVGNDIDDDFSDLPEGFLKYMITDYIINKKNKVIDIPCFTMDEFYQYIQKNY